MSGWYYSGALTYEFNSFHDGARNSNYSYVKSTFPFEMNWSGINLFRTLKKTRNIDNTEAYHDVIVVLPELSKGEVCALRHLKSASEQVLSKELLEIRNHLLVHGLQDRDDVGWKVENLQQISVNSSCLLADNSLRHSISGELLLRQPTIGSFSIFSWRNVRCLLIILTPLASVIAFIDSFCFSMVQIVEVLSSYCFVKSTTRTTWSCFSIIYFFNSMHNICFFAK